MIQSGRHEKLLFIFCMLAVIISSPAFAGVSQSERLLQNGIDALQESDYSRSIKYLSESFDLAQKNADLKLQLESLKWQIRYYQETADYNNAIVCAGKGLTLLKDATADAMAERSRNEELFVFLTLQTNAYGARKQYDKAWENMALLESYNLKTISKKNLVWFYIVRGKLLKNREEYDLAIKNLEEAQKLASQENEFYSETVAVCGLVQVYSSQLNFAKANELLSEIQEKAHQSGNLYLQMLILQTYSYLKADEEKTPFPSYAFGALALSKSMKNNGLQAEILEWVGAFYSNIGSLQKSSDYLKQANDIAKECGNTYQMYKSALSLLNVCSVAGDRSNFNNVKNLLVEAGNASPFPMDKIQADYYTARFVQYTEKNSDLAENQLKDVNKLTIKYNQKKMNIQTLVALGNIYTSSGRYDEAVDVLTKALEIRKALPEINEFDDRYYFSYCSKCSILNSIGTIYLLQADYSKAIQIYNEAIASDSSDQAAFIRMWPRTSLLAVTLLAYDFTAARQVVTDSLADFKKIRNPVRRAIAYNMLITILSSFSRTKGLNDYDSLGLSVVNSPGTVIVEKFFGNPELMVIFSDAYKDWIKYSEDRNDNSSLSIAYIFQGFLFFSTDRDAEALDSITKGIEYAKKSNAARFETIGYIYLAELFVKQKNYGEAFRVKLLELECNKKAGDSEGVYRSLLYLAVLSKQLGKLEQAENYLKQALEISEKSKDSNIRSSALLFMGNLYYVKNRNQDSIDYYKKALELFRKTGEKRKTAACLYMIAQNLKALNDEREVDGYYRESFELFLSLGSVIELRDIAISYGNYLVSKGRDAEALDVYLKAIDAFIEWRDKLPANTGRDKLVDQQDNRMLFEGAITLLIKFDRYEEALKYLSLSRSLELLDNFDAKKIQTGGRSGQQLLQKIEDLKSQISMLTRKIEDEKDLKKKQSLSGILASTKEDFFRTMNEIRSKNPDLEQLLTVRGTELAAIQKVLPADCVLLEYYPSEEKLYIFIVTSGSLKIRQVAVARNRLYETVKSYRQAVIEKQELSSGKYLNEQQLLYSFLINPVKDELEEKKNILVVPGGLLWYLPIETLCAESGKYILQDKNISYFSSSDISGIISNKGLKKVDAVLAAFGAPSGIDLPFSAAEVKVIGRIFTGSWVFTGENASKKNFLKYAPSSSIIHIATHSHLDKKEINNSFIRFAGSDGILKLGEIYGIHLPSAALVVLSSCESALGDDAPGAEFASLSTAFGTAGASSVIASLWKVEDSSCALLFEEFYKNLKAGKSRSESLRLAKLKLIASPKTSHPYYWGAFILTGDWR